MGSIENLATNPWLVAGFCAVMAFLGFLVARYVAGMTRVPAWQALRGGAGYLIGNVVVIMLCGLAVLGLPFGYTWGLAALALFVPLLMVVLGAETLLAFVFGIYRPRKADEVVRPAFDSRLLGWLTSPESMGKIVSETLNYQFGFEITRSWFYVLLGRALAPLIAAGLLILLGLSSRGDRVPLRERRHHPPGPLRAGGRTGPQLQSPLAPGPGDQIRSGPQPAAGHRRLRRRPAYRRQGHAVDQQAHRGESKYLPTAPIDAAAAVERTGPVGTGGTGDGRDRDGRCGPRRPGGARHARTSRLGGLVALQAVVTYRIGDLTAYVSAAGAQRPERLLRSLAERHLNALVGTRTIDDLLGEGRIDAARDLLQLIRADVGPTKPTPWA